MSSGTSQYSHHAAVCLYNVVEYVGVWHRGIIGKIKDRLVRELIQQVQQHQRRLPPRQY